MVAQTYNLNSKTIISNCGKEVQSVIEEVAVQQNKRTVAIGKITLLKKELSLVVFQAQSMYQWL